MLNSNLDLSKPAYSLTVGELVNIINQSVSNQTEVNTIEEKRPIIKGIHALAKYLGVCPAKAQALKNSGALPYFQNGRIVLFDPNELDKAMSNLKKSK